MPVYSYKCVNCGIIDLYIPVEDVKETFNCTQCQENLVRVYSNFIIKKYSREVSKKIEYGAEPKVVCKNNACSEHQQPQIIRSKRKQPWIL